MGSNGRVREISLDLEQDLGRTIVWKSGDVYYVDYDPQQDKIYWSNFNAIYSVNRNGSGLSIATVLFTDEYFNVYLRSANRDRPQEVQIHRRTIADFLCIMFMYFITAYFQISSSMSMA